jgi:hypothetical protein
VWHLVVECCHADLPKGSWPSVAGQWMIARALDERAQARSMVLGGLVSEPEATSFGRRWNGVGGRREGITWCGKLESLVKWRMFGNRVGVWPRLSKQAVKVVLEIRLFLLLMEGNWSCSWSRWSRNALHDKIGFVSVLQWQFWFGTVVGEGGLERSASGTNR